MKQRMRSVWAIVAGMLVVILLSLCTDTVLHATGIYQPWFQPMSTGLWVLATAYRIVYSILGAYVAVRLAPGRPMWHAMVFGIVGALLGAMGAASTWNNGPEYGPKWFSLGLIAISLPCAWAGAVMQTKAGYR